MTNIEKTKADELSKTDNETSAEEILKAEPVEPTSNAKPSKDNSEDVKSDTKQMNAEEKKESTESEGKEKSDGILKEEPKKEDNDLVKKFTLEVSKEEIKREFDETLNKYAAEIAMPGFRKGKVPLDVIKGRFNEAIQNEVVNQIVEKAVLKKIEDDQLKVISRPEVIKIDYKEGQDLKADVEVKLFPEIEIPSLETFEVNIPADELKGEEYDEKKQIDRVLEAHKRLSPISREIKDNDYVVFNSQAKILSTKRMTPKKEYHYIVLESEPFEILDLYSEIIGKKVNHQLTFTRSYPEDYKKKPWAGKEVEHYITIMKAFEYLLPEFNQEFLKGIGIEDEKSFKDKLKEEFERMNTTRIEDKKMKYIVDKLCEETQFPIPEEMVQQEVAHMIQQKQNLPQINMKDEAQVKNHIEGLKIDAEKSIRFSFIVDTIKEKFNLEISSDELEQQYKTIAEKNNVKVKEVRKFYMNKENAQNLKENLLREKVFGMIKEKVKINEV